jgi:hypothetical protein
MALMTEVTAVDDGQWGDWMLMAHASEKLNQPAEALGYYRRVLELLPGSPSPADERSARQEAEKKVKQMDPVGPHLEQAVDEFLRKLDALEREAITARSMSAMEAIYRLRGHTWVAAKLKDRGYTQVKAAGDPQDSGFDVIAKHTYHVRAAGTWRVQGSTAGVLVDCTASGTTARKDVGFGHPGQLLAKVKQEYYAVGEDARFTPSVSGRVEWLCNEADQANRVKNHGTVEVLIVQEN